jgi:hypothetical protein
MFKYSCDKIVTTVKPMIEKDQKYEKDVEDRIRKEIIMEKKNKGGASRKTAGLLISGVGGILYLILGLSQIKIFITSGYYSSSIGIPALIAGIISMTGTLIGTRKTKTGGTIALTSIPISLVIGFILIIPLLSDYYGYYYSIVPIIYSVIMPMLFPLPIPHAIHVVTGGILCMTGSDR